MTGIRGERAGAPASPPVGDRGGAPVTGPAEVGASRFGTAQGAALFFAVGIVLWFFPTVTAAAGLPVFYLLFSYFLFFWIAQASSWNMFTGYSGYFSFGQGAFYGAGVYTTATLVAKQQWPLLAAIPIGGLVAAALGLGVGLVVFRLRKLRGEIFALITLAVAFVAAAFARVVPSIDGGNGVPLNDLVLPEFLGDFPAMIYRLGLAVAVVTVFSSYALRRSRLGWGLLAISDNEDVAEALGVPTFRAKMAALGISTFFAGLSGAVHAVQISYVTIEDVFNIRVPLFVIIMSVLGGMRHWMGPVVGAVVIYTLTDRFNRAGFEDFNQIVVGALLIVMVLAVKEGLYSRARQRPLQVLGAFAVGTVAGVFLLTGASPISYMAVGVVAAIAAVLLPSRQASRPERSASPKVERGAGDP